MAAAEANLDFDWRDSVTDRLIAKLPLPLENETGVKCYRNVIFIWLFHTPVLLNWIDDNHEKHDNYCPLCALRSLARSFWDRHRSKNDTFNETFNGNADHFWQMAHIPGLIQDLERQNDAEEYMKNLLDYMHGVGFDRWTELVQVQKQCVTRCKECSHRDPDSKEDSEKGYFLQGTISRPDIEYAPLCHTLQFSKLEKASCKNDSCPSKKRQPKPDEDHRPEHKFFYALRVAPPILVIHCKPYTYGGLLNGRWESHLSGKVERLEHSLAFSVYPDASLDPNTVNWAFYHLYGVVLHQGDSGFAGHYACMFEQRHTGCWLFFNDSEERRGRNGEQLFESITYEVPRRELGERIDDLQKRDNWRIFMLMYRKVFEVPVRLLTRITFPSTVIALQDQQSHEESGDPGLELETEGDEELEMKEAGRPEIGKAREPETEEAGQPETKASGEPGMEDSQEEYFTPGECVGDESSLGPESGLGQTRSETQGAAGDEELQGRSSDSERRNVQAEQSMPTELPAVGTDPESSTSKPNETQGAADDKLQSNPSDSEAPLVQAEQSMPIEQPAEQNVEVEADPELSTSKSATEQTQGAADNVSQRDASDSEMQTGQAKQPLPAGLPTEQGVEVEVDPVSSTAKPDTTKTGSSAQAENENEEMASSQPAPETVRTEVEPSAQPKKKQAKGKAAKRTRKDEDEETSASVPASKKPKTGAKSSTQPKKKETKPKATKRTQKDASDDHEDEKAEKSAPPTKRPKTVVDLSKAYSGRETRARAAAKRSDDQIPDVDKYQNEQAATAKPATKKASAQAGKTEPKSKAGRKK